MQNNSHQQAWRVKRQLMPKEVVKRECNQCSNSNTPCNMLPKLLYNIVQCRLCSSQECMHMQDPVPVQDMQHAMQPMSQLCPGDAKRFICPKHGTNAKKPKIHIATTPAELTRCTPASRDNASS
mmetsp:Transcript_102422/g.176844  ORF Transcript_102422/g.176844 Transcript_102422/m.176844 type:complete len:124 (+) Transcript_102422:1508-1879(+)